MQLSRLRHSFLAFAADIKLAHSVFALPFAASAVVLVQYEMPSWSQVLYLILAMIGARSFAMGMNRWLDRKIDAANPRTAARAIPSGQLSAHAGLAWSLLWGGLFILAAFQLNQLAGWLSLPVAFVLLFYSYWKRFSWLAHWYLGFCLGLAPVAVCIALYGEAPLPIVVLGTAIMFWTAGFDILYSLQDQEFDRSQDLRSVPSRFGISGAMWLSRVSFLLMIACLLIVGDIIAAAWPYFVGVALIAAILGYEHYLLRDADGRQRNLGKAFFQANAYVSLLFLAVCIANYLWLSVL